jgi:4-amino-4-deoxy-L-arabinose transferase-like glycosyltransferase
MRLGWAGLMRLRQRIRSFIERYKKLIFWVSTGLIGLFAIIITLPIIGLQPFGFDEGWIAQAPRNMAETGVYASYGAAFNGEDKVFDTFLSTGPSVTLPIAAAFKLFGIGVVQARWVMLAFYVGTIFVLAWYVFRTTRSLFALVAPLSLLLLSSSGIPFRIDILGEVAAASYALGSCIAFGMRRYRWAGLLAGLAVLAKFIMIMLLAAGCIYFVLRFIFRWRHKVRIAKEGLEWALAAAAPLVLWEVVRFVQTGSFAAYKYSLKEFILFFRDNGSGVGETGSQGLTMVHKADMLLSNIGLSHRLLAVIFICVGIVLWRYRMHLAQLFRAHAYEGFFVCLYLCWWLFISNGAYTRYTVPVVVVGLAVLLRIVLLAVRSTGSRSLVPQLPLAGLATVVVIGAFSFYLPWQRPVYALTLAKQQAVVDEVIASRPRQLAHLGWWQNPEILFMSGLHSKELGQVSVGEPYWLLLGPAMRDIAPADYEKAKAEACTNTIFEKDGYVFCRGMKATASLW